MLDPRQLRLGAYLIVVALGLCGLLCWHVWRALSEASKLVALGDPRTDEAMAALLAAEDRSRMIWMVAVLGGVLLVLFLLGVVVTHRILGPARVLARTCRDVTEGEFIPPRPLRHGDLLAGLSNEFAAMVAALRTREEQECALLDQACALKSAERMRALLKQLSDEKSKRLRSPSS